MTLRPIDNPIGRWWGAFEDGSVWPVRVLHVTPFGTIVEPEHAAAPQGRVTLASRAVYDADFNHPSVEVNR